MSYVADHLAWQQRVAQEFKAQSVQHETGRILDGAQEQWITYPDLIEQQVPSNSFRTFSLRTQQQNQNQNNSKAARPFGSAFAATREMGKTFNHNQRGRTSIYDDDLHPPHQGAQLVNAIQRVRQKSQHQIRHKPRALVVKEDASQYSYQAKSKLTNSRGFQHGPKKEKEVQAHLKQIMNREVDPYMNLQPTVKSKNSGLNKQNVQRFNEDFESNIGRGARAGTLTQKHVDRAYSQTKQSVFSNNKSAMGKMSHRGSQVSKTSIFSRQRGLDKIGANSEVRSSKAKALRVVKAPEPKQVVEDIPVDYHEVDVVNKAVEEEELDKNIAAAMEQVEHLQHADLEDEEKLTSVSQIAPSHVSGRTYISELHKQLDEERFARKKLEVELESLKKVSEEISSHLSQIQREQEHRKQMGM